MVFNYHELADKCQLAKNVEGQTVSWLKMRQWQMDGETPHELRYKHNLTESFSTISVNQKVGHPVNLLTYVPKQMYTAPLPLNYDTHADVMDLCKRFIIPSAYHHYFNAMKAEPPKEKKKNG